MNHLAVVEHLIEKGAYLETVGQTALMYAAQLNHVEVARQQLHYFFTAKLLNFV